MSTFRDRIMFRMANYHRQTFLYLSLLLLLSLAVVVLSLWPAPDFLLMFRLPRLGVRVLRIFHGSY